jgi:hypothetical protein
MTALTNMIQQMQQVRGQFPSQPQANPAGTHLIGESSSQNPNTGEANAVTTLRSGKIIDKTVAPKQKPVPPTEPEVVPAVVPDSGKESEKEENEREELPEVVVPAPAAPTTPVVPAAPFPQRLAARPKVNANSQIVELFKKIFFLAFVQENSISDFLARGH